MGLMVINEIRTTLERAAAGRAGLRDIAPLQIEGRVSGLSGLVVDIDGLSGHVCVGDRLLLAARDGHDIPAEIVGFRHGLAQAMPFGALDGLGPGSAARFQPQSSAAAERRDLGQCRRLARPRAGSAGSGA